MTPKNEDKSVLCAVLGELSYTVAWHDTEEIQLASVLGVPTGFWRVPHVPVCGSIVSSNTYGVSACTSQEVGKAA